MQQQRNVDPIIGDQPKIADDRTGQRSDLGGDDRFGRQGRGKMIEIDSVTNQQRLGTA